MMQALLVPENTVVNAKGDGPALDVSRAAGRIFLLTLAITNIIEQESLDVGIYGSADGETWDAKPVVAFAQKFYREEVPLLLNLTARPEVKFIRAHWDVATVGAWFGNANVRVSCDIAGGPAGDPRGSRRARASAVEISVTGQIAEVRIAILLLQSEDLPLTSH